MLSIFALNSDSMVIIQIPFLTCTQDRIRATFSAEVFCLCTIPLMIHSGFVLSSLSAMDVFLMRVASDF